MRPRTFADIGAYVRTKWLERLMRMIDLCDVKAVPAIEPSKALGGCAGLAR